MAKSLSLLALLALLLAGCADIGATTTRAAPTPTPARIASATSQAGSPAPHQETDGALATASRLEQAAYLHRIGNYPEEQRLLLALLTDSGATGAQQQERSVILYRLVLAYLADEQPEPALDALERLLPLTDSLPREDPRRVQSVFLRAEALAGLGRSEEAVATYGTFLEQRPQATGPVEEIIADVWLAAGELPRAANALRRASPEATNNSEKAGLLGRLATTFEADERWSDAATAYDEILSFSVWPAYRASILYRAGAAYAAADQEETAISRWRQALDEAPASNGAYQSLVQLVNREIPVDLLLQGEINLAAAAYLPAIDAFERVLLDAFERFLSESPPYDDRAGQAWLGLGRAHLGLEQWDEALRALNQVLGWYPTCVCFGDAWLARARLEIARDAPGAGRRIYRAFVREHPDDPLAPEALWRSALSSLDADSRPAAEGMADLFDEAVADLLTLATVFPHSERAPDGLLKLGLEAFARGRYPQAAGILDRLLADYPDAHPDAARYWLGRARHAQGETDAARSLWQALVARDPETFYGVLAGLALSGDDEPGQDLFHRQRMVHVAGAAAPPPDDDGSRAFAESWLSAWVWWPPSRGNQYDAPNREARALSGSWPASGSLGKLPQTIADDPDLIGGELLLALGRRAEGLKLLEQVYRRYRDDSAALYPLMLHFDELEANQLSIRAAWYLIQRSPARRTADAPLFLQQVAYPRHFPHLVEQEATARDIVPLLFHSLVFQESLFEPAARSYAGARGLAQIMPSTGAEIAERLDHPDYHTGLLNRPLVNIRFGTFYLRWVRDYVHDNTAAALSGYNAGPGNARKWLDRRDRTPPDDALFIEFIPYSETSRYLRRILTHYYHYARIYTR